MYPISLEVAVGQTESPWFDIRDLVGTRTNAAGFALCAVETPSTLEATALELQGSFDDGNSKTAKPLYDKSGNKNSITVGTDRLVMLPPSEFPLLPNFIRVKLGTQVATAPKTITLYARPVA